jgi:uncharacterized protein
MADILIMKTTGKSAPKMEASEADPAILLKGKYKTRTWNHFKGEKNRLYCGIWECTPGTVTIDYKEWEFCHFTAGKAKLTNDKGKSWTLKKGDAFIIPAGFKGTWETIEKVRKHYVILMPEG